MQGWALEICTLFNRSVSASQFLNIQVELPSRLEVDVTWKGIAPSVETDVAKGWNWDAGRDQPVRQDGKSGQTRIGTVESVERQSTRARDPGVEARGGGIYC
jgi:hypothetical protein